MWGRGQSSYHRSDLIVNTNPRHINETLASAPVIYHNFADVKAMHWSMVFLTFLVLDAT